MRLLILFLAAALVSCNSQVSGDPAQSFSSGSQKGMMGEAIFRSSCASCHKVTERLTGPPLKGAAAHWKNREELYAYIKDPAKVISQNTYASDLQKQYGSVMTGFPNLSNKEIDAVLYYCDSVYTDGN